GRRGPGWDDDDGGGGGGGELRDAQHQQCGRGLHAPGGVGGFGGRDQRDIRHQLGCQTGGGLSSYPTREFQVGIDEVVTAPAESRVNSRLGPVSELTKRTPLQRQGRAAASPATRGESRPARENATHAPAGSPHPRPNWPSRPRSYRITTPPVALEGDHATRRTVGSDPSPHEPSGETRCVVPRPPRDGAR